MTRETFLCLEHAPKGVPALPYDDGCPACAVCGKANYAVKPYPVRRPR
jgi:hypothetical protein